MVSKKLLSEPSDSMTYSRSFTADDRAIEGLPIRLVIALVVGVAALALMLNMLGTIGEVGDTEVSIDIPNSDDQIIEEGYRNDVSIHVIDENGGEVEDATVVVTAGSAQLSEPVYEETETDSNVAEIDFDGEPGLRADQDIGTLEIEVIPPSDSNYIDEQPNPEIRVTNS